MSRKKSEGPIKKPGSGSKGRPRGIRRDRDCFTCRSRNVKCDLNRPSCSQCLKDNLTCEGYPSRVIWQTNLDWQMPTNNKHHNYPNIKSMKSENSSQGSSSSAEVGSSKPNDPFHNTNFSSTTNNGNDINDNHIKKYNDLDNSNNNIKNNDNKSNLSTNSKNKSSNISNDYNSNTIKVGMTSPSLSTTTTNSSLTTSHSTPTSPLNNSKNMQKSDPIDPLAFVTHDEHSYPSSEGHGIDIYGVFAGMDRRRTNSNSSGSSNIAPNNGDSIDPMQITNFLWGIKAILTAFSHAQSNHTNMVSHSRVERSEILRNIWKFVSSFLEHEETSPEEDRDLQALQLKTTAIKELQTFISEGVIEAIFSILAFTYFDVCQGSFGNWHRHLYGARSVLDIHCKNKMELLVAFDNTPGLRHAVTLLNWYDVMGVVASEDRPFIFEDWHREVIEDKFFLLVGCPKRIFYIFPQLFKDEAFRIRWFFQALQLVLEMPSFAANQQTSDAVNAVSHTEYAWKYACLLIAYEQTYYPTTSDTIIQNLVRKICELINLIPLNSALSQHLAVIVFMAGMRAIHLSDRIIVKQYWQFWKSAKLAHYADALNRCEHRWREIDEGKNESTDSTVTV